MFCQLHAGYTYIQMHAYLHTYTCKRTYIHTHAYVPTYIHMYTHPIHTHVYKPTYIHTWYVLSMIHEPPLVPPGWHVRASWYTAPCPAQYLESLSSCKKYDAKTACVRVHICACVHLYCACVYECVSAWVRLCMRMWVQCVYMCTCAYSCVCVRVHLCTCTCIRAYMCTCARVRMCTCAHACIFMYLDMRFLYAQACKLSTCL
jgi:hypothetical protein